MSTNIKKMKPIWYFVGLILMIIGGLVFIAGIYDLIIPAQRQTVLSELHLAIWWGIIMIVSGGLFLFKNIGKTVE